MSTKSTLSLETWRMYIRQSQISYLTHVKRMQDSTLNLPSKSHLPGHILPKEWADFRNLYDQAPSVSFETVEAIFLKEFGKKPHDIFSEFSREPVASASIAQVHRARVKDTGEEVAVKVQKPEIAKQIGMDLLAFRIVTYCLEKIFDLPLYWSADYIEQHIRQEVDFKNEARNAEKAAKNILEVPSLAARVYVPKVFWPLTTERIMTAEWIEGLRFSDTERVIREGHDTEDLMTVMVKVFCDQIFRSGFVHADPHPGNLIIRQRFNDKPQLVLLDHGLYVTCTDSFKHNYALLWKCLFTGETDVLEDITKQWGIRDIQAFASGTLPKTPSISVRWVGWGYERARQVRHCQLILDSNLLQFLADTDKVPKELVFIGRNLNIIRSNNKVLGSPVNRINITARYAVQTLSGDWTIWRRNHDTERHQMMIRRVDDPFLHLLDSVWGKVMMWRFETTLFLMSTTFYVTRFWQRITSLILGGKGHGFEDVMDEAIRQAVYHQYGIVLDKSAFDG
ncbi:ABC1 family-domain-containing protein [Chytridium lagenaria]|nr:ABC1 family-domain-containing protein [Chytridium lagenaria]